MIGSGIPAFNRYLEEALLNHMVEPVYAFSKRTVVESRDNSGLVQKVAEFRHVGFVRPYQDRFGCQIVM
jgi:hypothetical protein